MRQVLGFHSSAALFFLGPPHLPPGRQLHRDPNVLFAGYKFPHPLKYEVHFKVMLSSRSHGIKTSDINGSL